MNTMKFLLLSVVLSSTLTYAKTDYIDSYYFSVGLGSSTLKPIDASVSDKSDVAKSITLGFNINNKFALELGQNNLGSATLDSGEKIDYKVRTLGVVYNLQKFENSITPFVELGIRDIDSNNNVINNIDNYYSVGVKFPLSSENDIDGVVSYNDYAKDAQSIMFEISKKW